MIKEEDSNRDRIKIVLKKIEDVPLQWLTILFVATYVFLFSITLFLRVDTPTHKFILQHFHIDSVGLGFLVMMTVPIIPIVYYFFRNFQYVIVAITPLLTINFILMFQILRSQTAPLEHLLAHGAVILSFFILFISFEQLQAEREANRLLAEKNQKLMEKISRETGQNG